MHVLVWLDRLSVEDLPRFNDALERTGVMAYPVTPYYLGTAPAAGVLLGYASMREEVIDAGVRTFCRVLAELPGNSIQRARLA